MQQLGVAGVGEWLSLVEHLVRDQGVGGSNPLSPTIFSQANQIPSESENYSVCPTDPLSPPGCRDTLAMRMSAYDQPNSDTEYSFARQKLPKTLSHPLKRSVLDAALRSAGVYSDCGMSFRRVATMALLFWTRLLAQSQTDMRAERSCSQSGRLLP